MGKNILAIDPGTAKSAVVLFRRGIVSYAEIVDNHDIVDTISNAAADHLAIEMIASYGMPVGKEVFETCVWIGRMIQQWGENYSYVYRKDVKMHLCGSTRAKDSNIRQALIDRFGPGKDIAIGKKASPGPLYGFKKDLWAALAVAVTYVDLKAK